MIALFVYPIAWMYHSLFMHSLMKRHLCCFQFEAIMNKASIDIHVQVLMCSYVFISLWQRPANYSPWAQTSLLPVFVNKNLLEPATFICSCIGCFPAITAELDGCDKDCMMHNLKYLLLGHLQKTLLTHGVHKQFYEVTLPSPFL